MAPFLAKISILYFSLISLIFRVALWSARPAYILHYLCHWLGCSRHALNLWPWDLCV